MVELCDLFPEDTSCQPIVVPDPVEPEPVDPTQPDDGTGGDPTDEPDVVDDDGDLSDPEVDRQEQEDAGESPYDDEDQSASELTPCSGYYCSLNLLGRYSYWKRLSEEVRRVPFLDNAFFLALASAFVLRSILSIWRFKRNDSFYDLAVYKNTTNWWQVTDKFRMYGEFIIYSVLMSSQLVSMFGLYNYYNILVWYYGGMTAMGFHAFIFFLRSLTVDRTYSKINDLKVSNYYRKQSEMLLPYVEADKQTDMIVLGSAFVAFSLGAENWFWAQFDLLPVAEKDEFIEKWEQESLLLAELYPDIWPNPKEQAEEAEGVEEAEAEEQAEEAEEPKEEEEEEEDPEVDAENEDVAEGDVEADQPADEVVPAADDTTVTL